MQRLLNVTTVLSVLLMALVLFSVRRSHIRVEYSVSWLAAAVILFALSRSSSALTWIAGQLGLADPPLALMLLIFCVFVIVIYRLSVVISDLKDSNIAMAQRLAIVEFQLQNRLAGFQVPLLVPMKSNKSKKSKRPAAAVATVESQSNPLLWIYGASLIIALIAAFEVYGPALHGPFLLDDMPLPYMIPNAASIPLMGWLRNMRPLLMFSFWLNFQQSGAESTFGYHLVNLFLHFFNTVLIFLAVRKILSWASLEEANARILSFFAAGLFLLHPVQTESVSYIASRSETLSVFFVLAAFVVFLYRRTSALSIPRILCLLVLFVAAGLSKEHTAVLPALFILTDYYWNFEFSPSVIWRNWKLYVPIVIGVGIASVRILAILRNNPTAGFQMRDLPWSQYFFTECRVIWDYVRLFFVPLGQNLDPDIDISRNIMAHGAVFALAGLLIVSVLAWIYRRSFPLASYGWFVWLILLAPTSSLVPIRDPMAERRMYLPFIGLLFITLEILRRWKFSTKRSGRSARSGSGRRRRVDIPEESTMGQCGGYLERYRLEISGEIPAELPTGARRI